VYGQDPRDGFFREGVFYHPRLKFQIEFPREWKTANLTQAVVAAAPQNRAIVQLTLSGERDAQRALEGFYGQPGVRRGQSSRVVVHGQPAAIGEFQAQTDGGVVQGLAAFISYDGRVYQVLGYTPADLYRSFASAFEQTIQSFAPVTRQDILGVQPKRVDIVALPSALTIAQFADRYDSAAPADELAILNQQPTVDTSIAAGTLLKRIVG
jgi:predicted Zn-dependent protease